ncbi:MAG: hypothetical protein Q9173_004365 [Seirophora scorigena]
MSGPRSRVSKLAAHLLPSSASSTNVEDRLNIHTLSPTFFLPRAAAIEPEAEAIYHVTSNGKILRRSYQEAADRAKGLAYFLKKHGHKRVGILCPNTPAFFESIFGIAAASAVNVGVNYRLKEEDITYIFEHADVDLIIVDAEYLPLVQSYCKAHQSTPLIIDDDTDATEGELSGPFDEAVLEGLRYEREHGGRGWDGLEAQVGREEDVIALAYTSGTTAKPKGVEFTHRGSYLAALGNVIESGLNYHSGRCRYLWTLPMFHAMGWTFPWAVTAVRGTHYCLRKIDYPLIWKMLKEELITHFNAAPTVNTLLCAATEAEKLPEPVRVTVAASPPTAHLFEQMTKLNLHPVHVYGLTETYGPITKGYHMPAWEDIPKTEKYKKMARQGHGFVTSLPIRVIKTDVPEGTISDVKRDGNEIGEIVCLGNICAQGYYKDAEATRKLFAGGVLHTGDLAVWHPDGAAQILDRAKDIIVSGGENISSVALESMLATHEDILEAAVVAVADSHWGERPKAYITVQEGRELKGSDVIKWARHEKSGISRFMIPREVEIVDELPKTTASPSPCPGPRHRLLHTNSHTELQSFRASRIEPTSTSLQEHPAQYFCLTVECKSASGEHYLPAVVPQPRAFSPKHHISPLSKPKIMTQLQEAALPASETASVSSSSSSPERAVYDDTDFFTTQRNDSQSSLGVASLRDMTMSSSDELVYRISPISRLPSELLICCFSKLSSSIDLRTCMLVSKTWSSNAVDLLWHRPLCNTWRNLENVARSVQEPTSYYPYCSLVKRLNLSNLSDEINDGTVQPFMHCKRIERLTLTGCKELTDRGVVTVVDGSISLLALDITGLDAVTDHSLKAVAQNCPRLQGLNITDCSKVTDESLTAVAQSCRHLKRLKLNNCTLVTDETVTAVARHCPAMLEIDLHNCRQVTDQSIKLLISRGRQLRELRVAHCSQITDDAFLELPKHLTFDSLRILDLTACHQVHDDAVEKIIETSPRLRNLVLAKCKDITDRSVNAVTRLGKNLHYIHLGHCAQITDAAVIHLVKMCNRIRYIDLACCHRLTDASVQKLATLPKLRRIGLVKCQAITDRSIMALAKFGVSGELPSKPVGPSLLERVHLSYCVHLTLHGIHALLNRCPKLTHLSLTGVQAFFVREDLTAFIREAPPEFTEHQRTMFCVFSGPGVNRLRDYLNSDDPATIYAGEGTMYDDGEAEDGDVDDRDADQQVTGMMNATGLGVDDDDMNDEDEAGEGSQYGAEADAINFRFHSIRLLAIRSCNTKDGYNGKANACACQQGEA